jgi:hypothetical protein
MTDCKEWSLEQIARMVAYWHGPKIVVCKPGEGAVTVAKIAGYSGFAWNMTATPTGADASTQPRPSG